MRDLFHKFRSTRLIGVRRLWTLASLTAIVPVGFYTKLYGGPAADWVNDSLGGVFYEVFWCLAVFLVFPKARARTIALSVLVVTCILEFAQLWHPTALTIIRSHFLGATLLGTTFSWYDFPYYVVGAAIGWAWVSWLRHKFGF